MLYTFVNTQDAILLARFYNATMSFISHSLSSVRLSSSPSLFLCRPSFLITVSITSSCFINITVSHQYPHGPHLKIHITTAFVHFHLRPHLLFPPNQASARGNIDKMPRKAKTPRTAPPKQAMTRNQMYNTLGISNSPEDQAHTREFLNELRMELDIQSFKPAKNRDDFKAALITDITSPDGQLCASIRTAYANNSDECLVALYKLARLVKKSWVYYNKKHPTPPLQDDSDSDSDFDFDWGRALAQVTTQAANPGATPAATDTTTTAGHTSTSMPTTTAAAGAAAGVPPSAGPDNRARNWIPDLQFYVQEVNTDPALLHAEFNLSAILSNPAGQTSNLLHTTWVDGAGLQFVLFVDALSQGLGGISLSDLTQIDLWLRVVHPTTQAAFELVIGSDDGELGRMEEAFGTIMDEAMTYSWYGVLPLSGAPEAFDLMREIFTAE